MNSKAEKKKFIGISLYPETIKKLDNTRGAIPRSAFLEEILGIVLDKEENDAQRS